NGEPPWPAGLWRRPAANRTPTQGPVRVGPPPGPLPSKSAGGISSGTTATPPSPSPVKGGGTGPAACRRSGSVFGSWGDAPPGGGRSPAAGRLLARAAAGESRMPVLGGAGEAGGDERGTTGPGRNQVWPTRPINPRLARNGPDPPP